MARSLNELGSLYYKPLPQLSEYYLINLCKCITTDSVLRVMTKVMNYVQPITAEKELDTFLSLKLSEEDKKTGIFLIIY